MKTISRYVLAVGLLRCEGGEQCEELTGLDCSSSIFDDAPPRSALPLNCGVPSFRVVTLLVVMACLGIVTAACVRLAGAECSVCTDGVHGCVGAQPEDTVSIR